MPDITAKAAGAAILRPVIVRACVRCGGKRQLGLPCADCGNLDAPVVHDLGVQSASFSDPLRQFAWEMFGQYRAARRAREANKYVER